MLNEYGQLRFGDNFEIFLKDGQLRRAGQEIKLAPQPFQLLALLARRAGDLVTRDEIRAELWRDGATVEFDLGVNYCIRRFESRCRMIRGIPSISPRSPSGAIDFCSPFHPPDGPPSRRRFLTSRGTQMRFARFGKQSTSP
jgi:hypothetical protein